ncbi:MBL fold metallo-hydrolase [Saccharothrix variisporea]|uniref:Glyoxylase-like metal-dependent hydrolase (Beta-lactamase superfamily II) n=1 Tax=Saccharothrix variisporea TaxID=543527 RepID=A0A495X2M9_9PSEU|nr:MBL fold metallo-hydrolase [Saccharothrix variisporea]RKT66903.1 glyoxylase-like metal-dependent hydrolase (beta-lactamase superfamily II) [Saccharothrix variisporea]
MRPLAPGVFQLLGRPPHMINAYLVEDVLVDAGTPAARRRISRQLRGQRLSAHVVTHAHPDHFGSSHAVCDEFDLPLWAGQRDIQAIETATPATAPGRLPKLLSHMKMPDPHPVTKGLKEGDEVAGFTVLDVPGHSPGHIALWRDHDGVLICGDVFFRLLGVSGPPDFLTWDREQNRESMRRLADLRPKLVLFGHGRPLRDPDRLRRLVG